jgi:GntR family transcriptional regulator/MocR family aminotransferase
MHPEKKGVKAMLTYVFDTLCSVPLYDQLYHFIRKDIERKKLRENERLPSKRALASHLRISVITVENAYAQLAAEGYIYTRQRCGYYVGASGTNFSHSPKTALLPRLKEKVQNEVPVFCDFKTNAPSTGSFPFSVWAKLTRRVLLEKEIQILSPTPFQGCYELRQEITKHLYRFRGMEIVPEQVVIGAGAEFLHMIIVQLLGRSVYAVENPGYRKISHIYANCGASVRFIGLDEHGIDIKDLFSSQANVVHVTPSHHFPLGIVMPISRRRELLDWASDGNYIIEDDYDSEFRLFGKPIPSMQSIDPYGCVIYINTFSKSLAPSIRIAYMVLPPTLAQRYQKAFHSYACPVSSLEQYVLAKFMKEGFFERHLSRIHKVCRERHDILIDALDHGLFAGRSRILWRDAGLHFLLEYDEGRPEAEAAAAARANGVLVNGVSEYYNDTAGKERKNALVISYSSVPTDKITEGVSRLEKAVYGGINNHPANII